jgi:tetratricopeptide (TPR) repeat protein
LAWFGVLAICAAMALGPAATRASAQAADAQADAEYEAAISQAVIEFAAEHWQEARALFLRAHQYRPSARTLRGLGFCEFELRHYRDADRLLRLALADTRRPLTAEQSSDVTSALARAQGFLGRYRVTTQPQGATMTIDGAAPRFEADGSVLLEVGEHVLVASAPQHAQQRQAVDVRGGEREALRIVLEPLSGSAAAHGAASSEQRGGAARLAPWLLIGGGAAVAITGAVLFALGRNDVATVEDAEDGATLSELEDAHDRAPVLTGVGIALAIAGVASAAGGIVWLQTADSEPAEIAIDLGPGAVRLRAGF